MREIGVVGVPLATPYPLPRKMRNLEVQQGPTALRSVLRGQWAEAMGDTWRDYGDVSLTLPSRPVTPDEMGPLITTVEQGVTACIAQSDFVILLGGECYMASGTLPPLVRRYPDLHVLWFDAHPDFLSEGNSTTHFLDGMSLSAVVGRSGARAPILTHDQVTLLGGQETEPAEARAMQDWGLQCVSPADLERFAQSSLPSGDLFIHLDVDVLDARQMPAVDFPVTPGVLVSTLASVLTRIADTSRLRGIEVTCYNPGLDPEQKGAQVISTLLSACLKHHSRVPLC